jgi:hypothetical protein
VDVFRSSRHAKETVPIGSYLTKAIRYDPLCVVTVVGARSKGLVFLGGYLTKIILRYPIRHIICL